MKKIVLSMSIVLLVLTGCGQKEDEKWTAYVYPDKQNNKRSLEVGVYSNLKECKEASIVKLADLGISTGSYKCGLNCMYHEGMKTQICKKMVQ